ncbi:hypothetical protein AeRB84_000946 [Aphanomyces euteiches]|nr:hypothetical protein AeRB84_000946 [Aphanomyces euteiches]
MKKPLVCFQSPKSGYFVQHHLWYDDLLQVRGGSPSLKLIQRQRIVVSRFVRQLLRLLDRHLQQFHGSLQSDIARADSFRSLLHPTLCVLYLISSIRLPGVRLRTIILSGTFIPNVTPHSTDDDLNHEDALISMERCLEQQERLEQICDFLSRVTEVALTNDEVDDIGDAMHNILI